MNGGAERALESAERSWKAALAHMESGDLITAGALIRLTGRYVQKMGEEQGQTVGAVVPFPQKEARAGRPGGHESLPARTLTRFGMSEGLENAAQRVIAES